MNLFEVFILYALLSQPSSGESPQEKTEETELLPPALRYTYNPFGKRDPFKSFLSESRSLGGSSKKSLLSQDVSKFTLTGIIWGVSNPKAIVVDGEGGGHIISRGMQIGINNGRATKFLKDEVIIAEEFRDPLGKLMVTERSLKLKTNNKNENTK